MERWRRPDHLDVQHPAGPGSAPRPRAAGLWNPTPSPKVRCPGGARCRRRFRAGRRRRGSKEAGRRLPESPAWTRPGPRPATGFRVSPGAFATGMAAQRGLAARVAPFRPGGTGRATRRRRLDPAVLHARPAFQRRRARSRGRCAGPFARARRGARAPTLGRRPGWPCVAAATVGAPAAPCARPAGTRGGGGRRMYDDRAAPPLLSGPPHPDPPPAAAMPARSGAEHMLR